MFNKFLNIKVGCMKFKILPAVILPIMFSLTGCVSIANEPNPSVEISETSNAPAYSHYDVMFMKQMVLHHEAALEAAHLAVVQSGNPEVVSIAETILNEQGDEVEMLNAWAGEASAGYVKGGGHSQGSMNHGMGDEEYSMHHGGGLGYEQQLVELSGLSGEEFDVMFLKFMIAHHQDAVTMGEQFRTDNMELADYAESVVVSQNAEIEKMFALLGG